jgi:hypothetical protein
MLFWMRLGTAAQDPGITCVLPIELYSRSAEMITGEVLLWSVSENPQYFNLQMSWNRRRLHGVLLYFKCCLCTTIWRHSEPH